MWDEHILTQNFHISKYTENILAFFMDVTLKSGYKK